MVEIQPYCNFADEFVLYVHFMQTCFTVMPHHLPKQLL